MCGIIGRVGNDNATPYLLEGLGKLEYRGYDSAGIAVLHESRLSVCKSVGQLCCLKEKLEGESLQGAVGIGHTRWATHGEPSERNAHPHLSPDGRIALVHNGIIENADTLCGELPYPRTTDTDTEAVAMLLQDSYRGNPVEAVVNACKRLSGTYALGVLFADLPDLMVCTARSSPLVAVLCENGSFIASDVSAVAQYSTEAYSVSEGEICLLKGASAEFYDAQGCPIEKKPFPIESESVAGGRQGYEHYMLLEIMQQPEAVQKTLAPLLHEGRVSLEGLKLGKEFFSSELERVVIVACGSAYHAAVVGRLTMESLCRIPVSAELASEFRYSEPLLDGNTLAVFISQSGETADTLAALRLAKQKGARVLSIVNVVGSAIAKESDNVVYTKAGREIAVATTKAYSAQLSVLYALSVYVAGLRGTVEKARLSELTAELSLLPQKLRLAIDKNIKAAQLLSESLSNVEDMYFIGRRLDYAAAMEASLKMKEISYIHSEAYAAGELKHGTISLIERGTPVVAFAADPAVTAKTLSNIREVAARGARTVCITTESLAPKLSGVDRLLTVPDTAPEFSVSLSVVPMQLASYYTARRRGCDIDKPKNLAKSVTVE